MEATITMPLKEYNQLKDRLKNLEENYCVYTFVDGYYYSQLITYHKKEVVIEMLIAENKKLKEQIEEKPKKKFLGLF